MPRGDPIQIRGGTAAEWAAANPVLLAREPAFETDSRKTKYGDGVTPYNSLPYSVAPVTADPSVTLLGNPINATELGRLAGVDSNVQDQIDAAVSSVGGKAATVHTHAQSEVTGLVSALSGKAASSHVHAQSEVTGLDSALSGKAASSHSHPTSEVSGLDTALAAALPKAGGTMTGALTLAGPPTEPLHPVTKAYFDDNMVVLGNPYGDYIATSLPSPLVSLTPGGADSTAAFQALIDYLVSIGRSASIFFPPGGEYVIGGALQEPSGAHAQIVLPSIADTGAALVITLVGALSPPTQFFGSPSVLPTGAMGYSIIKSTLTGGTGTASVIAGKIPVGSLFNNVVLNTRDMIFQGVPNPTFTMLNLGSTAGNYIERTLIHAGVLGQGVPQPLNANSYGIILPPVNHSARNKLDGLQVWGYYWGIRNGELTDGSASVWSCTQGIEFPAAYHPSIYTLLGLYGCANGIVATADGDVYVRVLLCDIEHANIGGGWWQDGVADVYDPSNQIHGDLKWLVIRAGVGNTHTFVKTGGTNFQTSDLV